MMKISGVDILDPNIKDIVIELLEIAECNLLHSIKGVSPTEIYTQPIEEINSIGWIFGHCAVHLHWVINLTYLNNRVYSDEVCQYYRYGTTKAEILSEKPPISFRELVDGYYVISDNSLTYLKQLDESVFHQDFPDEPKETLIQMIKRVALHYMGHMGQIVLIRRALGNPGPSFVDGVSKQRREHVLSEWKEWWSKSRERF